MWTGYFARPGQSISDDYLVCLQLEDETMTPRASRTWANSSHVEFLPAPIHRDAIRMGLMDHRQPSLVPRFGELIVEGRKGDVLPIILIEGRVVVPRDEGDHAIGTAVVHRSQTHRAGMREDIERTADEMFRV
jgi:hypothetical protein